MFVRVNHNRNRLIFTKCANRLRRVLLPFLSDYALTIRKRNIENEKRKNISVRFGSVLFKIEKHTIDPLFENQKFRSV